LVRVYIRKDSRDRLSSFFATGHAGWAESGQDVVCAALSTVLQAAYLGLSEVAHIDVSFKRKSGRLELRWPALKRDDAAVNAIVATAALSVERIASQHPGTIDVIHERDAG